MKVLFINNGPFSNEVWTGERRFPIGLGYLSAVLKQAGHSVFLLDRYADPGLWLDHDVKSYDFVGVYTSTPNYGDALEILTNLERDGYKGPIAFGGPHTTAHPNTVPPRVDYVVQGEAEYIIADLVEGNLPSGVILRAPRVKDIDALPRADYELFLDRPRSYMWDIPFTNHKPIFLMNTSRSCPFTCAFCDVREIWGTLWRSQSPERIVDDIVYLKGKYDMAGVYFREDIFTASKSRVQRVCELLLEKNVDIVWACETRVDAGSDEEFIELMAKSGCRGIYVGAESGSQRMLDIYHKQISVEQIKKTCRLAKKHGIVVAMSLIVNHPQETWRDKFDTWDMLRETQPQIAWKNRYREEFRLQNYPVHAPREIVNLEFANSTWQGQKHRLGLNIAPVQSLNVATPISLI